MKGLRKAGYSALISLIPRNRAGDRFYAWVNFVLRHHRIPTRRLIFNDYLYKIKTTEEILNPLRVFVSDKELVKIYVKATVGDQYNVPTIAILRSEEEILNFEFPARCCIKATHASGLLILRENGEKIDLDAVKGWLTVNYYDSGREANYKSLVPKVIVEPLVFGSSNATDYKFFCFNGKPKFIQVDVDRHRRHKRKFFDCNWGELDFSILYPKSEIKVSRPDNLNEMVKIAAALSRDFSMIRVDLYSDGENICVGELTNVSGNACSAFVPRKAEYAASRMLFSGGD